MFVTQAGYFRSFLPPRRQPTTEHTVRNGSFVRSSDSVDAEDVDGRCLTESDYFGALFTLGATFKQQATK